MSSDDTKTEQVLREILAPPKHDYTTSVDCDHHLVMPTFNEEAARTMPADEVRKRWPRFAGNCPGCGQQIIMYASFMHYIMGDW